MRADIVRNAAIGSWPHILARLGIEGLTDRHGPCPGCGGKDRFRFDDKEGRGTWICGGGGERQAGDGFALVQHALGVDFATALEMVASALGIRDDAPMPPRPARKPVEATPEPPRTGAYAESIWARVDRSDAAVAGHPYAKLKGIGWHAGLGRATVSGKVVGRDADCLVAPIRDLRSGQVVAVQCINPDGAKQTFGPVKGHAYILGNDLNPRATWYVCEGVADAVSLFRAFNGNTCVFAAMGKEFKALSAAVVERYAPDRLVLVEDAQ